MGILIKYVCLVKRFLLCWSLSIIFIPFLYPQFVYAFIADFHLSQALEVIRELQKHYPIKRSPMRVRITVPGQNFSSLSEKLDSWSANIVSKDESGSQLSLVSLYLHFFVTCTLWLSFGCIIRIILKIGCCLIGSLL